MKKYFLHFYFFAATTFYVCNLSAQWCTPETAIPYAASMPGITHVVLNTIDRTSSDLENYPDNSYVYAEETTTLVKGITYDMSISFTVDAAICPDMNIRVWIDLDHNGSFDEIGETVISADHISPNDYNDSFYLPDYALTGTTRMRVTAKMSSLGGHSLPTPCDIPHDPFGYHGEFEDYDITISEQTGVINIPAQELNASVYPNPASETISIHWNSLIANESEIAISTLNGEMVSKLISNELTTDHQLQYNAADLAKGIYIISIYAGEQSAHLKLVVI